jgi:hypothetical protein
VLHFNISGRNSANRKSVNRCKQGKESQHKKLKVMKTTIHLLLALVSNIFLMAQTPSIVWQNNFGGSNDDRGRSIFQTSDGGFIISGSTESNDGYISGNHGGIDCWIIKLDMNFNIEWQKCFGGTEDESAIKIIQTSDNCYVFTGASRSDDGDLTHNNGESDIWVVKLDSVGEIIWQKSIGGPRTDIGWDVIENSEGDYIVAGQFGSTINYNDDKAMLIKISPGGQIIWEKFYGGSLWENAKHIIQTEQGGYVFVGNAYSSDGDLTGNHGLSDCWVVKLNSEGVIEWQKNLGGSSHDYAESIIQNEDGTFIFLGLTKSNDHNVSGNHGETDVWIVKLSSSGNIIWQKCFGGSDFEGAGSIINTLNSGYIFSGSTQSTDGTVSGLIGLADAWLINLDNNGELIWQQCYGGSLSDYSVQILNTNSNEFVILGSSKSEDYNLTGNYGMYDYWVFKIDTGIGVNETSSKKGIIFPNPSNGIFTIKSEQESNIVIRSIEGKAIMEFHSSETERIDISGFSDGIYILEMKNLTSTKYEYFKIIKN